MTTQDAITHFGGVKPLAFFMDVYPQTIYQWGEYPPIRAQYELEVRTKGALKAERGDNNDTTDNG